MSDEPAHPEIKSPTVRREILSVNRTKEGDQQLLKDAASRGITREDCLKIIKDLDTEEPSAITQIFVKGKWGGYSIRQALVFAAVMLQINDQRGPAGSTEKDQ